jgi:hypothetical protein
MMFTVRVLLFLTRSLRNDQFSLNEVVVSLKLFAVSLSYLQVSLKSYNFTLNCYHPDTSNIKKRPQKHRKYHLGHHFYHFICTFIGAMFILSSLLRLPKGNIME